MRYYAALTPFISLLALPAVHADFYVCQGTQTSQGGGDLKQPPIGGSQMSWSGLLPVDDTSCGKAGTWNSQGGFNEAAATNGVSDTNCNAGDLTLTGVGGGEWHVSSNNGDWGVCVPDRSVDKWCEQGFAVGINYICNLKCTSSVCDHAYTQEEIDALPPS